MLELLKTWQLSVMLVFAGGCLVLCILTLVTRSMGRKRKRALFLMQLSAALLLIFDRLAYAYRGDVSTMGYYMVRISNFAVFFLTLHVVHAINLYLMDLYRTEGQLENPPARLVASEVIFSLGEIMLIISQFTGFYYTFDGQNRYQRGPGFMICYVIPFIMIILMMSVVIQYRKVFILRVEIYLIGFLTLPIVASVLQIFFYGLSLINLTLVGICTLFFILEIFNMDEVIERSNHLEMDLLREEKKRMHLMFTQTAEALASAIDAKDRYTHGHSSRVAEYSRRIAEEAGKDEKECEEIYFAALLHDVGKIGVPDEIINKEGSLTDEEFDIIKSHPVIGKNILGTISQSPYLSIGANYHHERYDGRGYPEGLAGTDIPEYARIIAVADAYDAMTSKRSYRDPLPQDVVRAEIVKGDGKQFDPRFSKIMVGLIDRDISYKMKER